MPFWLIPLALLAVPLAEIATFVVIGGEIGLWGTLGLVLATAIAGSALLRFQGFAVFARIRQALEADRLPGREMAEAAMIVVAGLLLLTPGFITDGIGLALFVPGVRGFLWHHLVSRLLKGMVVETEMHRWPPQAGGKPDDRVVDLDPRDWQETKDEAKRGPDRNGESPWRA